jgi:hypothetical protein
MAITVTNKSAEDVQVSISTWGNHGDPNPYPVKTGVTESWDRKDPRGFVLYLDGAAVLRTGRRSNRVLLLPGGHGQRRTDPPGECAVSAWVQTSRAACRPARASKAADQKGSQFPAARRHDGLNLPSIARPQTIDTIVQLQASIPNTPV